MKSSCQKPTAGWACSRDKGHEGPCAALPTKWTTCKQRLRCLYYVLTSHNFILLHNIEEKLIKGQPGRKLRISLRTDHSDESDRKSLLRALTDHIKKTSPQMATEAWWKQ